jgi:hypothetical protein
MPLLKTGNLLFHRHAEMTSAVVLVPDDNDLAWFIHHDPSASNQSITLPSLTWPGAPRDTPSLGIASFTMDGLGMLGW